MPGTICVSQLSRWILQEGCRLQAVQEGRESVSSLKLQVASSGDRHTNKFPPLLSYCTCEIRQCSKKLVWFCGKKGCSLKTLGAGKVPSSVLLSKGDRFHLNCQNMFYNIL